jgi:hypothetical protein
MISTFVVAMLAISAVALAEEVVVHKNNVALRAEPSKKGKIEWRVNEGFELLVTERRDNWLKVRAPELPKPNAGLWVQAAQVTPLEPPSDANAIEADFRLEVQGSTGVRYKSKCVFVNEGEDFRHVRYDYGDTPAKVDMDGASVLCIVRTWRSDGELDARLLDREGNVVAAAGTGDYSDSLILRSPGPWGDAATRVGGGSYQPVLGGSSGTASTY